MCISCACLLPSCYIYISVFFYPNNSINFPIHPQSSFSDRRASKHFIDFTMIRTTKSPSSIKLILSAKFLHNIRCFWLPARVPNVLSPERHPQMWEHYALYFLHQKKPTFSDRTILCIVYPAAAPVRHAWHFSSTLDRIAQNIISEQGSFSPILTCTSSESSVPQTRSYRWTEPNSPFHFYSRS